MSTSARRIASDEDSFSGYVLALGGQPDLLSTRPGHCIAQLLRNDEFDVAARAECPLKIHGAADGLKARLLSFASSSPKLATQLKNKFAKAGKLGLAAVLGRHGLSRTRNPNHYRYARCACQSKESDDEKGHGDP